MSEEVLINSLPCEVRVALVEDGVLQEVQIERSQNRSILGNIYYGKVVRVLPGMQAAFVDIGLERTAFIHASDISHSVTSESETTISDLVYQGQMLMVQVIKAPVGNKGARLTTHITLACRYLVYLPVSQPAAVSQRITDDQERQRLKQLIDDAVVAANLQGCSFIARTVAEGVSEQEIATDLKFLGRLWQSLQEKLNQCQVISLIYEELSLDCRAIRDLVRPGVQKIRIDCSQSYQKILTFSQEFVPEAVALIEYYQEKRPIFDLYQIESELDKALKNRVELKSGGYLVIEQTEAMTTIDVNTGAFVGHRNLAETIFKTNLEAVQAIGRQLRLRNLGGIIVLDFIDMADDKYRQQVWLSLEQRLAKDRAKTRITNISELGLVEMTRKRSRQSLEEMLCEPCSVCHGRGTLKTTVTVCLEIYREIRRTACTYPTNGYLIIASQLVVDCLIDEMASLMMELEAQLDQGIKIQVENSYHQEQFDVILL